MSIDVEDLQLLEPTEFLDADPAHELACCCDTFTSGPGTDWVSIN